MSAALDRAWVDQVSDLYRRICSVTTLYTFTAPVDASDIATVRDALAAAVPECTIRVVPEYQRCVHVELLLGERTIYQRAMIVEEQHQ